MGDHDYGTHDTNLCAECLGYAIGKRVALREAADDWAVLIVQGKPMMTGAAWLRARADTEEANDDVG